MLVQSVRKLKFILRLTQEIQLYFFWVDSFPLPPSMPMDETQNSDEILLFIEDDQDPTRPEDSSLPAPWKILIIDDDPDVHTATMYALTELIIRGRGLEYQHAYSTQEAKQVLLYSKDIAVILLDVVMDMDDAGLHLVNFIRNTLAMSEVRIVLRTGQAGYAPEMEAIRDFDINDYKSKTELTQAKLLTAITSAVRAYEHIRAASDSNLALEMVIRASADLMACVEFKDFAEITLATMNDLFDLHAEGFVCIQHAPREANTPNTSDALGLWLIACTEQFAPQQGCVLSALEDKRIQLLVQKAVFEKRSQFENKHTVLIFLNASGHSVAMYLACDFHAKMLDKHILELFSRNVVACLDKIVLSSRMHQLAFYDPLTGLANRFQLLKQLGITLNSDKKTDSALALIDVDHFSETNDALGHQFGDLLLSAIGRRIKSYFGEACTIARVGNDIFALLGHEDLVSPTLILSLFFQPFSADKEQIQLSATVGLVRLSHYTLGASEALKDANIALKRAKMQLRSGFSYFTREMGVEIRERVRMMHALRAAFDEQRLFVVYQPQIQISSGQVIGLEALLRWKNKEGEFVPPNDFIPIAEYSGLIINIGEWVLRSACFELKQLERRGFEPMRMAVNVSQAQFNHPLFFQTLERALADSRIPASQLELEITESIAMNEPQVLIETLAQIKALGVRVSIDDFGTGFSSLSQLQKLSIDKLKIDRAFIRDISDPKDEGSIAKMIVQLSQSLQLEVIAEGVETEQQALALQGFGCDYAQGFLYAKPMKNADLEIWLRERSST